MFNEALQPNINGFPGYNSVVLSKIWKDKIILICD